MDVWRAPIAQRLERLMKKASLVSMRGITGGCGFESRSGLHIIYLGSGWGSGLLSHPFREGVGEGLYPRGLDGGYRLDLGSWRSRGFLALLIFLLSWTSSFLSNSTHEVLGHGLATLLFGGGFHGFYISPIATSAAYLSSPPQGFPSSISIYTLGFLRHQ